MVAAESVVECMAVAKLAAAQVAMGVMAVDEVATGVVAVLLVDSQAEVEGCWVAVACVEAVCRAVVVILETDGPGGLVKTVVPQAAWASPAR
jgi:hypothetical protein